MDDSAAMAAARADGAAPVLRAPSLVRRMACWLYEGMLLFGVYFFATALFSLFAPARSNDALHGLLQLFLFIVCGIYFVWFWSKGQTLAMKTWRVRITDTQGRPVGQVRAFVRYVLSWVWVLPPLALMGVARLSLAELGVLLVGWVWVWALLARFHPQRQFWHDHLAGTRLIDATAPANSVPPAPEATKPS